MAADAAAARAARATRETERITPLPSTPAAAGIDSDPFADLVADVATAIATNVPSWRVRVGEVAAAWQREGIATGILERALRLTQEPDVDGLLVAFAAAVARLRALEAEAAALDTAAAGASCFRDPTRAAEAQQLVERLRTSRSSMRAPLRVDAESWVTTWPDVAALLITDR